MKQTQMAGAILSIVMFLAAPAISAEWYSNVLSLGIAPFGVFFIAVVLLGVCAGISIGGSLENEKWNTVLRRKETELANCRRDLDSMTDTLISASEVMEQTNGIVKLGADVSIKATEHIKYQDELLKKFYEIIMDLTENRIAMLSDAEKHVVASMYSIQSPDVVDDEDVAHHLVCLGALDELPSGKYALSGDWRRMIALTEKRAC